MEKLTYEQWMKEVDKILLSKITLTTSDMPDFPSRDKYDDGVSPQEGAESCLEYSEWPNELLD